MKLSIFMNMLLVSSLAFVAIGCGKDKKKKGGSDNQFCYNGYCSQLVGGPVTGQGAIDALNAYVNAIEPKFTNSPQIIIQKKRYSCSTKDFLGINFLPYQKCSSSNLPTEYSYPAQNQTRLAFNPLLGTLLTPVGGYTRGNVYQQGQYIFIDHVSPNGYDTIQYTIDTAQHAEVNPIQVKDTALQQIDYVSGANI